MIPNPRFPGAPARMADGRLFTDYRANCFLMAPLSNKVWAEYDRNDRMKRNGAAHIATDRTMTIMQAGQTGCVDTMVPELTKKTYTWQGPIEVVSHPVGIGAGRMYLPGRRDLLSADPDVVAATTFPAMHGTFSPNTPLYMSGPVAAMPTLPNVRNRYSAPHGA
jgi:hypothetical protein